MKLESPNRFQSLQSALDSAISIKARPTTWFKIHSTKLITSYQNTKNKPLVTIRGPYLSLSSSAEL